MAVMGVPRIWQGEDNSFFSKFGNLHVAKPCALLGGFGGMPPPPREIFFKLCILVRFGVYFVYKNFKNYHFLYKNFKNCNFLYERINILYTRLLWGNNYSREEIF